MGLGRKDKIKVRRVLINLSLFIDLYLFSPLGLKASFNPSPTKLILKIVNIIINAGGIQSTA